MSDEASPAATEESPLIEGRSSRLFNAVVEPVATHCSWGKLLALATLALSASVVALGVRNLGECKAEPNIPVFLVVAGVIYVVFDVARIVRQFLCRDSGHGDDDDEACRSPCFRIILPACVTIAWLIPGTIWTMGVYDTVDTVVPTSPFYCPHLVYSLSFWLIVGEWIISLMVPLVLGLLACGLLACGLLACCDD